MAAFALSLTLCIAAEAVLPGAAETVAAEKMRAETTVEKRILIVIEGCCCGSRSRSDSWGLRDWFFEGCCLIVCDCCRC